MSYQEQLIENFVETTGSSRYLAEQYLERNNDNLVEAIEDYFASNKADPSNGSSRPASSTSKKGGVRTFRDIAEDVEDDKTETNYFTGGEKSGLEVEEPPKDKKKSGRSLIEDLFNRAREQMGEADDRPSATEADEPLPKFTGTGFKLGDGEQPSQQIPDASAHILRRPRKVSREITFWRQGFSVGDGPLNSYEDPANAQVLEEMNHGRVPLAILDVEFGQDVDVSVIKKTDEDYTPPKRKVGGFSGSGHRLGSPVPGEPLVASPAPESSSTPVAKEESKPQPEGEGDTNVQIRFANGKRVSHKFNSTDSISVVYDFVRTHEFSDSSRSFILSHAFPVKPIEDSSEVTVADAKLKNAVIVQRWS